MISKGLYLDCTKQCTSLYLTDLRSSLIHPCNVPKLIMQDFLMLFSKDIYSCWHIFTMQVHGKFFHQRLQDQQQFLVEMWSDCSGFRHHQGPLMLEPTIVNSTVTLVIPHLPSKCHVMATIHNQKLSNPPRNITFG